MPTTSLTAAAVLANYIITIDKFAYKLPVFMFTTTRTEYFQHMIAFSKEEKQGYNITYLKIERFNLSIPSLRNSKLNFYHK